MSKTKRSLVLEGLDKELELKKVAEINLSGVEFIYMEKMKDGDGWRLTYTATTIPDITKLQAIRLKRD